MDFSTILILPFSAIVAFATLTGAAIAKRRSPRLIWPCLFSILVGAFVFLRLPDLSVLGLWMFALLAMAFSAAIGSVLGGAVATRMIASRRAR